MSNNKYQNCTTCNAVFINVQSDRCHYCNLTKSTKKQFSCTSHLSLDDKKRIANLLATKRIVYSKSMPVIKKDLGLEVDYKAVRSIVASKYYKSIAFE